MSAEVAEHVDPTFPSLHIRPPRGWLNDPNGVSLIDGRYHVFFQYNPAAPTHGNIHWGHASSDDLLHWRDEPIALRPRSGQVDDAGCWSGSVVDDDGVPTAVYTAVPDEAHNAQVVLARSDRSMLEWVQDEDPQMGPPADPTITDVRDPFVFTFEGHRYAVQGAGRKEGSPQVLAYACDDLTSWTELGPLLTYDDPVAAEVAPADIWECPNLVQIDGRWVLLLSLWQWVDGSHLLAGVRYLIGDLTRSSSGLTFRAESGGTVDEGPAFYAPQALSTPDRTLLWGWGWEQDRTEADVAAAGWAGALTFPRELTIDGDRLISEPAAELTALRQDQLSWQADEPLSEISFEVITEGPLSLVLVDGRIEQTVAELPGPGRVLVDGSMIESFVDGTPFTTRAYPTATSHWELRDVSAPLTVYRLGLEP
jgi:beta-fructofuranosidase